MFNRRKYKVLVPFSGFLYLYHILESWKIIFIMFSSPSRGSYISTNIILRKKIRIQCSRPLLGVLISLPCPRNPLNYIRIFLLLRRKCNSIPYTDLIPHKIQDNVLFSTMRGKTGRYWEQLI